MVARLVDRERSVATRSASQGMVPRRTPSEACGHAAGFTFTLIRQLLELTLSCSLESNRPSGLPLLDLSESL